MHVCRSVLWVSFNETYCTQCIRIIFEGLTMDGVRNRAVNLHRERRNLIRLYRGTPVLRKRLEHERQVLQSVGFEVRDPQP